MRRKTYEVEIPITGIYACTVTVPADADEDDIYAAAVEMHSTNENETNVEWEFTHIVAEGNVTHAVLNEWSYIEVKK